MSRVRLAYTLALLGILITTGGCAESATAPEATLRGAAPSAARAETPTQPAEPVETTEEEDGTVTVQSGFLSGGQRAEAP
jgi:hypothetical protein